MNNSHPKVTIGMPVYNGARWLSTSIESILAQSFTDFELIISDNASTDETKAICEQLARTDARVSYYRNSQNVGASDNYNLVFAKARGDYFKWASCNDFCMPKFLEKCVRVLDEDQSIALAYPRTALFTEHIEEAEPYDDNLCLLSNDPCQRFVEFLERVQLNNVTNGVIRSKLLAKTPLVKNYYSSDTVLMAELSLHGKFFELPETLFYRRMDEASATKLKTEIEVRKHWNPDLKPVLLSNTREILQYFGAIRRATLTLKQRVRLNGHMLRQTFWAREKMWHEIVVGAKYIFGIGEPK